MLLILSDPMPGLELDDELTLGPFQKIRHEDGWLYGDDEKIAEVFRETAMDMMNNYTGHPAAGYIFAPRTFNADEADHPDYPGKPYRLFTVIQNRNPDA